MAFFAGNNFYVLSHCADPTCRKGSKGEAGALVLQECFSMSNVSGAGGIEATSCACASWVSDSLGSEAALGPESSPDSLQVG